jgi:hypothetical protein
MCSCSPTGGAARTLIPDQHLRPPGPGSEARPVRRPRTHTHGAVVAVSKVPRVAVPLVRPAVAPTLARYTAIDEIPRQSAPKASTPPIAQALSHGSNLPALRVATVRPGGTLQTPHQ